MWDARNRLVGISGEVTASFGYDPLGRRVSKTIGGVTAQFAYDGNDIVQKLVGGVVTASYLRSLNIDELFGILRPDGPFFVIHDGVGSTRALTNPAGTATVLYSYEPFGKTQSSNPAFVNPFQFTGRENDGTGLYSYRARYYRPEFPRFTSEDPRFSPLFRASRCQYSYSPDTSNYIDSDQSLGLLMMFRFYRIRNAFAANPEKIPLYTYAENDPVNKFDPMGLVSGPQNLGCDLVPDILEGRCSMQCCNEHDDCYKRRRSFCDFTSWLDVGARFARPDCLSCNRAAVQCIARNILKGKKNLCDLTDF